MDKRLKEQEIDGDDETTSVHAKSKKADDDDTGSVEFKDNLRESEAD